MNSEPGFKIIESELKSLKPIALSDCLLDRLDSAMAEQALMRGDLDQEVIITSIDPELARLEESLRSLSPNGMPNDLINRLDSAMQKWHEEVPLEEKVVQMHPKKREKDQWLQLRSVAIVSLLGALLALVWNGSNSSSSTGEMVQDQVVDARSVTPVQFVSKDAQASVVSANDHGLIWTKDGQPLRCIEVEVQHRLEFESHDGVRLTLEEPKREMRIVPAKFN